MRDWTTRLERQPRAALQQLLGYFLALAIPEGSPPPQTKPRIKALVKPARLNGTFCERTGVYADDDRSRNDLRARVDLLRRGRTRSEFERFAAIHADGLLRSAYLMSGDRGEAEDLVQECLLRLARRWPRVRSLEHPGAYARRVLFNLALDGGRKRTRRRRELQAVESPQDGGGESPTVVASEARTDLLQALGGLPPRQRAVLVLRYFADLSETEVATILDCPLGTVKSSTSRGLERLRQTLELPSSRALADDTQPKLRRTIP
jgi:RNA polymerase sigma-70 factor (sigma-E family)